MAPQATGADPGPSITWVVEWVVGAGTAEKFVIMAESVTLSWEADQTINRAALSEIANDVNGQFADDVCSMFDLYIPIVVHNVMAYIRGDAQVFIEQCVINCRRAPAATIRMYHQ